jgi:cytidylate kinase
MIITIDGPTASGKSTIAKLLAEQLDVMYINSGLMYRATAYVLRQKKIPISHDKHLSKGQVTALFQEIEYSYTKDKGPILRWNGQAITHLLKTADIDLASSVVALQPIVRQDILDYERRLADAQDVIADGRDCGTVIFPQAEHKFYITASLEVRALRWQRDQLKEGKQFTLDECMQIVGERDRRDAEREISPMKPADDALIIDTSTMTVQDVITELITIIQA